MRILLAVAAVAAACQGEPEPTATSIPAATFRYIDSAVAGCRDAAYYQYYDSPFRLGWAQAECDKAGEEARKGDWGRGLLPTPSPQDLTPTAIQPTPTITPTPQPYPTHDPYCVVIENRNCITTLFDVERGRYGGRELTESEKANVIARVENRARATAEANRPERIGRCQKTCYVTYK